MQQKLLEIYQQPQDKKRKHPIPYVTNALEEQVQRV